MITSIDIPTEDWVKFRIAVMQQFPGPNINRVIQELVTQFANGDIKIQLECKSYSVAPRSKEKKAPRKHRLAKSYKNKWVALIDGKPATATSSKEETERLTREGYGELADKAIIVYCE